MRGLLLPAGPRPARILCLGAHADDIEIGCGATILELLARRKAHVTWVVFSATDEREREARKAARLFLSKAQSTDVIVHRHRDGFFPYSPAIKDDFEALKARLSPDVIFTHCRHDRHQDHRVVSDLTWNTFRDHLVLEYEIPKYDADLRSPNLLVPVGAAAVRRKVRLLQSAFGSQRDRHWFTDDTFLGLMRLRGLECRAPSGYAEGFYAHKAVLDLSR
jgi:LmbE family N-acetylglucosaminyl deacetylase